MAREQEVLRGGSPLSVAVTVSAYSARSEWLRGDDERSSPVFGFKENRSALGPGGRHRIQSFTGDEVCVRPEYINPDKSVVASIQQVCF